MDRATELPDGRTASIAPGKDAGRWVKISGKKSGFINCGKKGWGF